MSQETCSNCGKETKYLTEYQTRIEIQKDGEPKREYIGAVKKLCSQCSRDYRESLFDRIERWSDWEESYFKSIWPFW